LTQQVPATALLYLELFFLTIGASTDLKFMWAVRHLKTERLLIAPNFPNLDSQRTLARLSGSKYFLRNAVVRAMTASSIRRLFSIASLVKSFVPCQGEGHPRGVV
jgi:hypothetical protein